MWGGAALGASRKFQRRRPTTFAFCANGVGGPASAPIRAQPASPGWRKRCRAGLRLLSVRRLAAF